jgi:hypothetical protein
MPVLAKVSEFVLTVEPPTAMVCVELLLHVGSGLVLQNAKLSVKFPLLVSEALPCATVPQLPLKDGLNDSAAVTPSTSSSEEISWVAGCDQT